MSIPNEGSFAYVRIRERNEFAHVVVEIRRFAKVGVGDVTLEVRCQADKSSPNTYGWTFSILNPNLSNYGIRELLALAKSLQTIQRRVEHAAARSGRPGTFAEYALSVIKAAKCPIVFVDSSIDNQGQTINVGDLPSWDTSDATGLRGILARCEREILHAVGATARFV